MIKKIIFGFALVVVFNCGYGLNTVQAATCKTLEQCQRENDLLNSQVTSLEKEIKDLQRQLKNQNNCINNEAATSASASKTTSLALTSKNTNTVESSTNACPKNCSEAKTMGMSNMTSSHPCWQAKFDRDKDGIGCEN